MSDEVVIEVVIGAPVDAVWDSLRDRELLRRWHGWHYDDPGGAGLDAEIEEIYFDGVAGDGRTLHLSSGDRFVLSPVDEGTRVRVVRPPYSPGDQWADFYADITEGWRTFLTQLRFMHEVQPGRDRQTIFLTTDDDSTLLTDLVERAPSPRGAAYLRAELQYGVVLPELGPGLLIVARKPDPTIAAGEPQEPGGAMAVVTTYGLGEAAFEAEKQTWGDWWTSAYPSAPPAV